MTIKWTNELNVQLIDHMGSDETVVRAARVSTGKDLLPVGKTEGLINYLIRENHSSTVEHCVITFRLHVPVFTHRQIMTHRTLSKNSESGRYKELEPVFYIPPQDRPLVNEGSGAHPKLVRSHDSEQDKIAAWAHKKGAEVGWELYQAQLDAGIATEVARNVLPTSIYTSAWVTGNLLGWFNFLRLRDGKEGHPQWEVQKVAEQIEEKLFELYPITMGARERHR